jgi:DNA uptake protein ComE-like DNA-binding protein
MLLSKLKSWLAEFFYFNKQERNGVFVLCILLILVAMLRLFLPSIVDSNHKVEFITLKAEAPLELKQTLIPEQTDHRSTSETGKQLHEKFVFNPNTISVEEAKVLGFSKKLSATLFNFRNKGGKFFKPEDLKKLYGMSPGLYAGLESYILIPDHRKGFKRDTVYPVRSYEKKVYVKAPLEINTADSLAIVYLKGIGPGFTKRIIKYRTMLGGFHSPEQLKEIYGMTDSVYDILISQIVLNKNNLTKIPVNAIDLNSLKKHPYFSFQSAQAIVNYRNKHGKLTEEDLLTLGVLSPEKLRLVMPYLQY